MTIKLQSACWSEYFAPDATSDRGWLKAICAPYNWDKRYEYTHDTSPVADDSVSGGWREQSTLGNYLDYGTGHHRSVETRTAQPGNIHCICYVTKTTRYCETVREAKAWIESEALRGRPELVVQQTLALSTKAKAEAA